VPTGSDNFTPRISPARLAEAQPTGLDRWTHGRMVAIGVAVVLLAIVGMALGRFVGGSDTVMPPYAAVLPAETRADLRMAAATDALREYFLDHGTYRKIDPKAIGRVQPAIEWVGPHEDSTSGTVSVASSDDETMVIAVAVDDTKCSFERLVPTEGRIETQWTNELSCRAADPPGGTWSNVNR
jgi:hypothetical protein